MTQSVRAQRMDLGLEPPSETTEPHPRAGITEVYLLLLGYTAECFIKARLTRKLWHNSAQIYGEGDFAAVFLPTFSSVCAVSQGQP